MMHHYGNPGPGALFRFRSYNGRTMSRLRRLLPAVFLMVSVPGSFAVPKPHTIILGQWRVVNTSDTVGSRSIKVRQLIIDGRVKEYTVGLSHEITDRLFVIARAYRLNDALPQEAAKPPSWTWQLGGWISVDRATGHVAQLNLPAYDSSLSEASWYRDYAAYCGSSDDGGKAYMVVSQLGRRKPVLKKEFAGGSCPAPKWERGPGRVTFISADGSKVTFVVQGHSADPQAENSGEEGPQ